MRGRGRAGNCGVRQALCGLLLPDGGRKGADRKPGATRPPGTGAPVSDHGCAPDGNSVPHSIARQCYWPHGRARVFLSRAGRAGRPGFLREHSEVPLRRSPDGAAVRRSKGYLRGAGPAARSTSGINRCRRAGTVDVVPSRCLTPSPPCRHDAVLFVTAFFAADSHRPHCFTYGLLVRAGRGAGGVKRRGTARLLPRNGTDGTGFSGWPTVGGTGGGLGILRSRSVPQPITPGQTTFPGMVRD